MGRGGRLPPYPGSGFLLGAGNCPCSSAVLIVEPPSICQSVLRRLLLAAPPRLSKSRGRHIWLCPVIMSATDGSVCPTAPGGRGGASAPTRPSWFFTCAARILLPHWVLLIPFLASGVGQPPPLCSASVGRYCSAPSASHTAHPTAALPLTSRGFFALFFAPPLALSPFGAKLFYTG